MKDRLAEQLLAKVLNWTSEEVAIERPIIQALASYKYDEYQQFSTGSRFIESLALWLNQFETASDRRIAYAFVKERLIFCSASELRHLVEMAYPDHIRPLLIERAANGADRFRPKSVASRVEFRVLQRQSLFLGLSDGARIDAFRRANDPELNHEQIWQTHELSADRVAKLLEKLDEHLQDLLGRPVKAEERRFRTLVLLDDFSASGTSYFSHPAEAPTSGKIFGFLQDVCGGKASPLIDPSDVEVVTLLYMATDQALEHIRTASAATWGAKGVRVRVEAVQRLPRDISITPKESSALVGLIGHPQYYDHAIFDRHFQKGMTEDARFGYAGCGLPLVLHHNTPNNSIALLMSYEDLRFRGLFPRIQRHREMS